MPCEMCGKEGPLKTAKIEGNKMRVCGDCAKFGQIVEPASSSGGSSPSGDSTGDSSQPNIKAGLEKRKQKRKKRRDVFSDRDKVLVEDYGDRVRKARQKKDLTPEELSDQINEKKSVISHTERNDHHPSDDLVKKLERALDITLMEKPQHTELAQSQTKPSSAGKVTLGDLLKDAMDKEDES